MLIIRNNKFLYFSLLGHICLTVLLMLAPKNRPLVENQILQLELLTPSQITQSLTKEERLQIVQQDNSTLSEETREDAKFLSQKNQNVHKETVAAQKGKFQNIHQEMTGLPKSTLTKAKIQEIMRRYDPSDSVFQKQQDSAVEPFLPPAALDAPSAAQPAPPSSSMSQTEDHLKDVDQGLETLLNTKEYKYYAYFDRIRNQLSHHWQPKVRERLAKLFRSGRGPASVGQERVTRLLITLDSHGSLLTVKVLGDSGIEDLDDAAIEAFRSAAPFPNPPKGVIEADGTVQIRWDFVLET